MLRLAHCGSSELGQQSIVNHLVASRECDRIAEAMFMYNATYDQIIDMHRLACHLHRP